MGRTLPSIIRLPGSISQIGTHSMLRRRDAFYPNLFFYRETYAVPFKHLFVGERLASYRMRYLARREAEFGDMSLISGERTNEIDMFSCAIV